MRRRLTKTTTRPVKPFALPVRILVVVARPDDAGFIDPRAITIPLLDAVAGLGDDVVVEFLPQPTLTALSQRLRDRAAPSVHVVHFDGHGVYDRALGLGYLLFENEEHRSDEVDANRLGTLLNETGVPLMVLNACQSGMQKEANPYASVAARLIRTGVGSVLAMNYSVLVVAAHKFVAAFYAGLANGLSVGQAVDAGRLALLSDVERHKLVRPDAKGDLREETIRLQDWFLPALYQQSADPTIFPTTSDQPPAASDHSPLPTRQTYPGLVGLLAQRFNLDELHLLAYQLGLDYEELAGEVKTRKILSLVDLMERQNRLPALIATARSLRPDEQWDAALTPAAAAHSLSPSHSPAPLPPSPPHPATASGAARGSCCCWNAPSAAARPSCCTASAAWARRRWPPRRGAG